MVESRRVLANGRIRASTEKLSGRLPKYGRIRASTGKLPGRIPKNGRMSVSTAKWTNPCEYWEKVESMQVPKNCLYEYRKMVESV